MEGNVITMRQFVLPKLLDNLHSSCASSLLFSVMGIWIISLNLTTQCENLYETKKYNMLCTLISGRKGKESEEPVPKTVGLQL